jgi:hypothetical protein
VRKRKETMTLKGKIFVPCFRKFGHCRVMLMWVLESRDAQSHTARYSFRGINLEQFRGGTAEVEVAVKMD